MVEAEWALSGCVVHQSERDAECDGDGFEGRRPGVVGERVV